MLLGLVVLLASTHTFSCLSMCVPVSPSFSASIPGFNTLDYSSNSLVHLNAVPLNPLCNPCTCLVHCITNVGRDPTFS